MLVRRLNAEEVLGAIDLVVTDKTGTLTENRLDVASVYESGPVLGPGTSPRAARRCASRRGRRLGVRRRRSAELLHAGARGGPSSAGGGDRTPTRPILIAAEPLDDRRPWTSTTARRDGHVETLFLGAPEAVLDLVLGTTGRRRAAWHERIEAATASGERVVGLARRSVSAAAGGMLALIGFADPLRPGVPEATSAADRPGSMSLVVTGDHPTTAAAIGAAGRPAEGRMILGSEIDAWTDDEVADACPSSRRRAIDPGAKQRIVDSPGRGPSRRRHRRRGERRPGTPRGGCGGRDGQRHGCGQGSVGSGAQRRLVRDAVFGIGEGRRIVDNVQKGLVFLLSTHVALLGFIFIATVAGYGQPLLPIQILWLELFIDLRGVRRVRARTGGARPHAPTASAGASAAVDSAICWPDRRRRWVQRAGRAVAHGELRRSPDHARWLAFTTLVCAQAVRAYANRSLREPLYRLSPNPLLFGGVRPDGAGAGGDPARPAARRRVPGHAARPQRVGPRRDHRPTAGDLGRDGTGVARHHLDRLSREAPGRQRGPNDVTISIGSGWILLSSIDHVIDVSTSTIPGTAFEA